VVAFDDPFIPLVVLAEVKAQLADYLILGVARASSDALLTFDKKLARSPGAQLL
jgi:predicted nucleic acid-binding protein